MDRDSRLTSTSTSGSFKLDEGFAEDSQQNGEQIQNSFVAWLNTQSEQAKAEIAYEILRTLRSTDIAAVVERLNPLLHMDPIEKLPPEITAQVFSYLDAATLLTASLSSTTWRERILDPRLWQELYKSQGWGIHLDQVTAFEEAHTDLVRSEFKRARENLRGSFSRRGKPVYKRRATSGWLQSTPRRVSADVSQWRDQHGAIEADEDLNAAEGDEIMTDAPTHSPHRPNKRQSQDSSDEMDITQDSDVPKESSEESNLLLVDDSGQARLNWPHVYKQRHKLEQNWLRGRFTNFQLPHPNFPTEAHTECVYTVQFFGKWLVSGSRDKTLRIWDLDTRRLRGKPLVGHSQSVLCLQFDPTDGEDTIISGSSDSSLIVWKFSTGQKLHVINSAHEESVLNLRFDRRYLVTCSKDKKIKVWNRKSLLPTDPDYPRAKTGNNCSVPQHVIDLTGLDISTIETRMASGVYRAIKPFSLLMTLDGHNAAVNAIQIFENKIVSASGDRHIRMWDINIGACVKTIPGHNKGIACVQYDGKRIVSGSSDNTVRIFDAITGTEVAVLLGHANLVRTVQAGFGDMPGSEADEIAAARAAEHQFRQDLESGKIVEDRHLSRRIRNGEFGSSRITMGSTIPPGGGGSKWARIVSGSYDESIIIWKKDSRGHWVIGQTLKQDEDTQNNIRVDASVEIATRAPRRQRPRQDDPAVQQALNAVIGQNSVSNQSTVSDTATLGSVNGLSASQIVQATVNTSIASLQTSVQNIMGLSRTLGAANGSDTSMLTRPAIQTAMNQISAQAQAMTTNVLNTAINNANLTAGGWISGSGSGSGSVSISALPRHSQGPSASSRQLPTDLQQAGHPIDGANQPPRPQQSIQHVGTPQTPIAQPAQSAQPAQPQQAPPPPPAPAPAPAPAQNHTQSVSRVFKLQFDARRIVCCSQDSRIIGWDFANGDTEIEECAKFFEGP